MSRKTVLIFRPLPEALKARIAQEHTIIEADPTQPGQEGAFLAALAQAHGAIGASVHFDAGMLDQAPNLEVLSSISVGVDYYPHDALRERGILLCHTPDVLTESVADLIFGMVLVTSRRMAEMDTLVRQGHWDKNLEPEHFGHDVHGKTLGVLGYGRIGQALARRAALGFGMPVLYHSRRQRDSGLPEGMARAVDLDSLLAESDFLVLILPLTEQTRGMMDAQAFARMKPGAILINGARGPIVQEQALLDALDRGQLRAAGLDVYDVEPLPLDSPLRGHPRILTLPHMGSATHETRGAMAEMAVNNLLLALRGETPLAVYRG